MGNRKILIVDDEEEILVFLEKRLAASGYQVVKASSGKEAFLKAKAYSPDLILLDIVLPDIDGADVAKLILEDPSVKAIPIIFMSGIVSKEDSETKPKVTVGGYRYSVIPKPFDYEELLTEIGKIIER